MRKIKLKVLGLSYSQTQEGSYVIVLSEEKGMRKLPIIIKPGDAQVIALKIEGMKSPRPLTHDLFKSFSDSFGIDIQEIYIHNMAEGIFYTKIIATNGLDDVAVECAAGDGIALSITFDCPIYVSESVLNSSGIMMDDNGIIVDKSDIDEYYEEEEEANVSIESLEQLMKEAVENEEYEIATSLRDKIKTLKEESK
jgi:bifunctional DNase/RNase